MKAVVIGSLSPIKAEALRRACAASRIDAEIVLVDASSGVNAQPVGRDETLAGARNRAMAARAVMPDSLCFGIENGIFPAKGKNVWLDAAAIVMIAPDGNETVAWSPAVVVPDADVAEARRRGFAVTTVGSVLAGRTGCDPADPHAFLTRGRMPRMDLLSETITGVLSMLKTHRVTIGAVVRDLPIREVAPGIRVALFNILGDWELTEAAGKALAKRVPEDVEALLMPDGKAIALLHVIGRETLLPTVVARKEQKPYMASPVESVSVKSITTDKVQTLFLGADDAAVLRGKKVAIVDDVVSSGGTIEASKELLKKIGGRAVAVVSILTEGTVRPEVISLGHLPLF